MWRLREAYADMNFQEFHKTLNNPRNKIITDELIVKYIAPLNRQVVLSVIKEILKSYRTIRLDFLAQVRGLRRDMLLRACCAVACECSCCLIVTDLCLWPWPLCSK